MARWGEGAAKGTRQEQEQRTGRRYVAGATASAAIPAGAGAWMVRSGQKGVRAGRLEEARLTRDIGAERAQGLKRAKEQQSPKHLIKVHRQSLSAMSNRPAVQEVANRAHLAHNATGTPKQQAPFKAQLTRAVNHPMYQSDMDDIRRTAHSLHTEQGTLRHLQGKFAASQGAERHLKSARKGVQAGITHAMGRRIAGGALIAGAAGIPLAALATRKKVGREWTKGSRYAPPPTGAQSRAAERAADAQAAERRRNGLR